MRGKKCDRKKRRIGDGDGVMEKILLKVMNVSVPELLYD